MVRCVSVGGYTDLITEGSVYRVLSVLDDGSLIKILCDDLSTEIDLHFSRFEAVRVEPKSTRFKVGDWVVCVDNKDCTKLLTEGKLYLVEEVTRECLRIRGNNGDLFGYYKYRFDTPSVELEGKTVTVSVVRKKGSVVSMESIKQYFRKNQDTLMTIGVIALLDEFLLGGSLRDRIKSVITGMLDGVEKRLKGSDTNDDKQD